MKIRVGLIAGIVALNCIVVNAQDSRQIKQTYRKQENVYLIGSRLWMTPTYSKNGQVCLMRVYPRAISGNSNYLDPYLDISETLSFINRLFPVNTRGRRGDDFGISNIGGGVIWTNFYFEKVQFVFISTFDRTNLSERAAKSEPVDFGPVDEAAAAEWRRKEDAKSDDQLIQEHTFQVRVLEIYWPDRKCVKF